MAPSNNDASQQAARKRPRLGENYSPNTASSTPPLRNPYSNNTKRKQVPAAAMVPPRNRRPVADERPMLDYMGKRTGFDHHYSNEYNYAYGDGSGRKRGGRNPKDMKITEVLSQRLMEAMHLSEGGTAITASKDSEPEEQLTKGLEVQRKKRFDRSKMEGDISQLALQNSFFVGGVRVGWPYPKILSPQRQMAIHLIKALKDKKHVVLESPTGTGKSAAILCSVLAWQRYHAKTNWGKTIKEENSAKSKQKADSQDQSLAPLFDEQEEPFPKIIYCSRTHSQVEQMVASLKKTPYRPRMTVLGSRERLCIHKNIINRNPSDENDNKKSFSRSNVSNACQLRVKNTEKVRKDLWKSHDFHYDDNDPPVELPGDFKTGNEASQQDDEGGDNQSIARSEGDQRSGEWILKKSGGKATCPHYRQLTSARTAQMARSHFVVNQDALDCCTSGGEESKLGVHDIEDLVSFGMNPHKVARTSLYRINGEGSFGFELGQNDCRIKKIASVGPAKSNPQLQVGDKVVAVNGIKLHTFSQICQAVKNSKDPLKLTVIRKSRLHMRDEYRSTGGNLDTEDFDITLGPPEQQGGFGMRLSIDAASSECTVNFVNPGGAAEASGRIQAGDEIAALKGVPIEHFSYDKGRILQAIAETVGPLQLRVRHLPSGEEEDVLLCRKPSLGIVLGDDASCIVEDIVEGSVADRTGGIGRRDRIVAFNGCNTETWTPAHLNAAIDRIGTDQPLQIRVRRAVGHADDTEDIEDREEVDLYSPHSACPYYLSRALAKSTAEIIFCPYNYILDPDIRHAMDIDLDGAVVVLDEAHNVEGTLTESGSGSFGEIELSTCVSQLSFLSTAMKSAKNTVLLKDEREEMDLSVVAHELLLFVEKISLHLHRMRVQFEMSKGNKSAKKAIEEYLKFKTPDDKEFELSYDGPTGHGVLQKAVGCKPFFEKLGISKSDMERLYKYSQALESQLTSRNGQEDGPDVKKHSNDQERNTVVDLLSGMLSKLTLAAENPEHFYISCVAKPNGSFDYAAGLEGEEGENRSRFKKKPKSFAFIHPRSPHNPNAQLPVCGHQECMPKGEITLGSGTRHGDWCKGTPKWEGHLVLKLLFPGLLMKDLATKCRSVVLASGSLSPISSLCAELDLQDETTSKTGRLQMKPKPLEANHVVDLPHQLLAVSVGYFPDGTPLTVTYNNYKQPEFFPKLGNSIATVIESIPRGGILVFFPSYSFLNKCIKCWNTDSRGRRRGNFFGNDDHSCPEIWDRFLSAKGKVIIEPSGSQEKFEAARDEYRDTIAETGSCILLAVFRGKMSEGISFNDDNARGVICVGIPFPGARDTAIIAKKAYNDEQRKLQKRTNLLPSNEWYQQEAYRSISQALGRCIRHAADYGTVVLLDSRHCNDGSPGFSNSNLPKWMRHAVRNLSMGSQGFGSNPIVGGYRGLSRAMLTFFQQAPAHCQAVLDKMHRDLANANAREQERQSSGHEFDSKTGVWTPGSSSTAQPTPRPSVKSITQDSPMPLDGAQRLQSAASVPPKK